MSLLDRRKLFPGYKANRRRREPPIVVSCPICPWRSWPCSPKKAEARYQVHIVLRHAVAWLLVALLLFASVATAQQTEQLRIPFRTENNMILVDVTVNGAKAVLMLDTGSTRTALNPEFVGVGKSDAVRAIHQGVYLHRTVNLQIAKHYWSNWRVLVIDIAEKSLTRVDGLLGEDWLRTFSSFRIDYKNSYIELEEKQ